MWPMAANNLDSSLEPDIIPMVVSEASGDQRPSVISLGTKSRGLPGLLTADSGDNQRASNGESNPLLGEVSDRKSNHSFLYFTCALLEFTWNDCGSSSVQ